jgi:hypothetical protein
LESDKPYSNGNLYAENGDGDPGAMCRILIPRHGGKDPGSAPRNDTAAVANVALPPSGIDIGLNHGNVEMPKLPQLWKYTWHLDWRTQQIKPAWVLPPGTYAGR